MFYKNKVKEMKTKPDPDFILDDHSILKKAVKLKYTVELTTVVHKKLTSLIILEFHDAKGHQGISDTVNMMRCYFWWIGMWKDVHQHINTCKLYIQFLPFRNSSSIICRVYHGFYWTTANFIQGTLVCTNIHLPTNVILFTGHLKTKSADEVSMAYMKEILPKTSCPKFILQDNGTEFKNEQLISVFNFLGIKCVYRQTILSERKWQDRECTQPAKVHNS